MSPNRQVNIAPAVAIWGAVTFCIASTFNKVIFWVCRRLVYDLGVPSEKIDSAWAIAQRWNDTSYVYWMWAALWAWGVITLIKTVSKPRQLDINIS